MFKAVKNVDYEWEVKVAIFFKKYTISEMKFIDVFVKDMQLDLEILAFHIMTHIFRCKYIVNRFISRSYIHAWLHLTFSGRNLGLQNNSKAYRSLGIFHTEFLFLKSQEFEKIRAQGL